MRILIHGINFAPELTGVGKYTGELAEWLSLRGHDVTVVTAAPYYPEWRIAPAYKGWQWKLERYAGARVIRCPIWVPSEPSGVKRLLHLSSFALSSMPVMLALASSHRPDVVLGIEPPLVCSPVTAVSARLSGSKSWLHVQDFEVDAAFSLGVLAGSWPARLGLKIERALMAQFSRVSTISPRMIDRLEEKGVPHEHAVLFWNWVDTDAIFPLATSELRSELGIPEGAIVALFSGSMTKKQGLSLVAHAARRLSSRNDLFFVFCGAGVEQTSLVRSTSGCENVRFLPLQPADRLNQLLNLADIHLLTQLPGAADLVMPSKLQGMFASGRPVVATAEAGTQLANTVSGRGSVVPPGDLDAFISAIERLASDHERRRALGAEARHHALAVWRKDKVLSDFEAQLVRLADN